MLPPDLNFAFVLFLRTYFPDPASGDIHIQVAQAAVGH